MPRRSGGGSLRRCVVDPGLLPGPLPAAAAASASASMTAASGSRAAFAVCMVHGRCSQSSQVAHQVQIIAAAQTTAGGWTWRAQRDLT